MLRELLKDIIDELDFRVAFGRVKYDTRFDYVQVPVEVDVFNRFYEKNVAFLKEAILQETYSIGGLRKIWVPKEKYFLRPGSIPLLEDRLVFQALVDKIAKNLENQLPPAQQGIVFSSRLNTDSSITDMFLPRKDLWMGFKNKAVNYCDMKDTSYVLVADIASYFENINLENLANLMISAGVRPTYVNAISYILKVWANGRTRGLPQMLAPCSLLADFYLNQVDKNMILRGYRYIRYVDDIRIFVSSSVDLRKAMLDLTEQLRPYYLDLQASKTDFYRVSDFRDSLVLIEKHMEENGIEENEQDALFYFEPIDNAKYIPEHKLLSFLEKLLDPNNTTYNDRDLRFCLTNLGRIGSPAAIDLVLSKLYSMPQDTFHFVKYLLNVLPNITEEAINKIIEFLGSDFNIYDWQMMWLLIFLSKSRNVSQQHLQNLISNEKLQKHYVNRAILTYILCSKGGKVYQQEFMSRYNKEEYKEVKMAILCGLWDLERESRNQFYHLAGEDHQSNQLIEILKNEKVYYC